MHNKCHITDNNNNTYASTAYQTTNTYLQCAMLPYHNSQTYANFSVFVTINGTIAKNTLQFQYLPAPIITSISMCYC